MSQPGFFLPWDEDEPLFDAPWQAQVFALTVKLHEAGCFSWAEWSDRLAAEIVAAQRGGDPDVGDTYYHHWLRALERIVTDRGLLAPDEIQLRREAWERAAREAPHGEPIVLKDQSR